MVWIMLSVNAMQAVSVTENWMLLHPNLFLLSTELFFTRKSEYAEKYLGVWYSIWLQHCAPWFIFTHIYKMHLRSRRMVCAVSDVVCWARNGNQREDRGPRREGFWLSEYKTLISIEVLITQALWDMFQIQAIFWHCN